MNNKMRNFLKLFSNGTLQIKDFNGQYQLAAVSVIRKASFISSIEWMILTGNVS